MSAVRTLTALGAALGQSIPELARSAADHVTLPALRGNAQIERTLEVLLDRLCLSLTLAKPVGLVGWVERETPRLGRAAVVDLTAAALHAIALAAGAYEADHRRLLAFLDVLSGEIERGALGGEGNEERDRPGAEGTTALLAMLAERDYGTCCHSKATAEWARRLATAMDCGDDSTEFIALCALLHDIGKISTPDHVLLKPAPLAVDEWDVMRDHSAAGARILNQVPTLARCAIVVRAHHERFDGAGYPDGLFGATIPFEARVVAVADAFHAMISERPYRQAIAPRQALRILQDGRGSQWDPDVVDAMLGMFARRVTIVSHAHTNLSSA
ncbi:MAG TPA: HD-GYP domain-containing protein [Candidatus Acidoferrales bacterium]|nr:HD-GYP domain-containing protein [Candidatus Acidoferrales bacterium]